MSKKIIIPYFRPVLKNISYDEYARIFDTQSMNASAKISLLIQHNTLVGYNFHMKTSKNWHQIKDFSVQVSQLGFAFFSNNFFFRIANEAVQQLCSAGIMQWMIDKQVGIKLKFETQKDPTKLTVESLSFGFVIWLGCCGFCVAAFVCEFCFYAG